MTRAPLDEKNPPVSLEEQYSLACNTSDLGLPTSGVGAQGILAAAAWTEVSLGSALRRLRTQWEAAKPVRKHPRSKQQLVAAGLSRDQARAKAGRERIEFALAYYRERTAVIRSLREFSEASEHLMTYAAGLGMDDADVKAFTVLQQWLDRRGQASFGDDGRQLMAYLDECMAAARAALQQGMRGHTKHERDREELDAIARELGLK